MKDVIKVFVFVLGFFGYMLLTVTTYVAFQDKWYSYLLYAVMTLAGFGVSALLKDDTTCPCCKKETVTTRFPPTVSGGENHSVKEKL